MAVGRKKEHTRKSKNNIRICGGAGEPAGKKKWPIRILRSFCVFFLALTWWGAFLNVFQTEISLFWLGAGLLVLSIGAGVLLLLPAWAAGVLCLAGAAGCAWFGRDVFPELFHQLYSAFLRMADPLWDSGAILSGSEAWRQGLGLAAAAVTFPLILLWQTAAGGRWSRIPAGLLIPVPMVLAACAGYFPDEQASWLLILAAGMYLASGSAAAGSFWKAGRQVLLTALVFGLVILLSARTGQLLDGGREIPGGFYQTARTFLSEEVIGKAEELLTEAGGETGDPEEEREPEGIPEEEDETDPQTEWQQDPSLDPDQTDPLDEMEGEGQPNLFPDSGFYESVDFSGAGERGSSMDRLKEISRYTPDDSPSSRFRITLEEKPHGTWYYATMYGGTYTGDAWLPAEEWVQLLLMSDLTEAQQTRQSLIGDALVYPEGLTRLELLSRSWDKDTADQVGREINQAFSRLAVYDTNPGATPADRDFAEYFLFENHRGFCVHFASAAVLLYRMCGYPAMYAEGYAVPASAFWRTESGEYTATVDGTMGHAWCMLYDQDSGRWVVREHTPAASGTSGTDGNDWAEDFSGMSLWQTLMYSPSGRAVVRGLSVLLILLVLWGAVWTQAALRRRIRLRRIDRRKGGEAVCAVYEEIIRLAGLREKLPGGALDPDSLTWMKERFPEIREEDWEWMYGAVMRSLFYLPDREEDPVSRERIKELWLRFRQHIWEELGAGKKFLYRFIYCL